MKQLLWGGLLFTFLCFPFSVAHALWHSKEDNKSIAELQLMTPAELCLEAMSTIPYAASMRGYNPSLAVDADDYIQTIGRVVWAKQGREPPWTGKAIIAIGSGDGMKGGKLIETECGPLLKQEGKETGRKRAMQK